MEYFLLIFSYATELANEQSQGDIFFWPESLMSSFRLHTEATWDFCRSYLGTHTWWLESPVFYFYLHCLLSKLGQVTRVLWALVPSPLRWRYYFDYYIIQRLFREPGDEDCSSALPLTSWVNFDEPRLLSVDRLECLDNGLTNKWSACFENYKSQK